MLAVNIKFCIANFSTGIPFKIHFLIKKSRVFSLKKVDGSEIVGLKIFCSNNQASMIFITYTFFQNVFLKCLQTMQLILYDDGNFICSVKVWAISFVSTFSLNILL